MTTKNFPAAGTKILTKSKNLFVCVKDQEGIIRFFYMTPDGTYLPAKYTVEIGIGKLPTYVEWAFLFKLTKKVESLLANELKMAEELIPLILASPLQKHSIASKKPVVKKNRGVKKLNNSLLGNFSLVKGFEKLHTITFAQQ